MRIHIALDYPYTIEELLKAADAAVVVATKREINALINKMHPDDVTAIFELLMNEARSRKPETE